MVFNHSFKKYLTKKKNIYIKNKKNIKIISNKTPLKDNILKNIVHSQKNKLNNFDNYKDLVYNKKTIKKSFSPLINKQLFSLINQEPNNFLICNNNLLKINIGTQQKPKCLNYNNKEVQLFLLQNLKSNQKLDCSKIIPPKQILSNCWFNTFFMTFFISDKGRKFFRFFRQLMIERKNAYGKKLPDQLAKAFFMFNIAIEASTNHLLNKIAYQFNTNLLIQKIYNAISQLSSRDSRIRKVGESGNPLDYYLGIIQYLHSNVINIITLHPKFSAKSLELEKLLSTSSSKNMPDVIVVEIYDYGERGAGLSGKIKDKEIKLNINNINYVLDSIVIRDIEGQHFCSLLTCNKEEYCFDGASYTRMSPWKWKSLINKNKRWKFESQYDMTWNFRNGYQLLFYYRI